MDKQMEKMERAAVENAEHAGRCMAQTLTGIRNELDDYIRRIEVSVNELAGEDPVPAMWNLRAFASGIANFLGSGELSMMAYAGTIAAAHSTAADLKLLKKVKED